MVEDEMLAEIGITDEEYDEAVRRLVRDGFLEWKPDSEGGTYNRTEKPFCKVEWDDADPRVCQVATDVMTKVLPMLEEECSEEFERTLRRLERDGLVELKQGDADIVVSLTAKGRAWKPPCGYTL